MPIFAFISDLLRCCCVSRLSFRQVRAVLPTAAGDVRGEQLVGNPTLGLSDPFAAWNPLRGGPGRPPANRRQPMRSRASFRETPWAAFEVASQASHRASRSAKAARTTGMPSVPRKMRSGGRSASITFNTAGKVA